MTKKHLAEQVLRILVGGNPRTSSNIKEKEVQAAVVQVIAELFKIETVTINQPYGAAPPFASVAVYENQEVEELNSGYCKVKLPVQPITLPRNMGIWMVYRPSCLDSPLIPLDTGTMSFAVKSTHNGLSAMLGDDLIVYEPWGYNYIRINRSKDVFGDTATIQLLVHDPNLIEEQDQLPVPQDFEGTIIRKTLELFGVYQKHDTTSDAKDG